MKLSWKISSFSITSGMGHPFNMYHAEEYLFCKKITKIFLELMMQLKKKKKRRYQGIYLLPKYTCESYLSGLQFSHP